MCRCRTNTTTKQYETEGGGTRTHALTSSIVGTKGKHQRQHRSGLVGWRLAEGNPERRGNSNSEIVTSGVRMFCCVRWVLVKGGYVES